MQGNIDMDMLVSVAHGIARQLGPDCEICIHDLKAQDLNHTIAFIINGHITGRKVGDGASRVVLETLEKLKRGQCIVDHLGYRVHTQDGRTLKASSIFLKDESGEYRYILGINYDITKMLKVTEALNAFLSMDENEDGKDDGEIKLSVNDLLDSLINQSVRMIGKPPALMSKEEKVRAIGFLKDAGAFLVTKSGDKVSQFFGISKFTLYSYIDQNKQP